MVIPWIAQAANITAGLSEFGLVRLGPAAGLSTGKKLLSRLCAHY
eukprot:SAG31_NODE_5091_length_2748_cov_16.044923_2_plen_45_part_00